MGTIGQASSQRRTFQAGQADRRPECSFEPQILPTTKQLVR